MGFKRVLFPSAYPTGSELTRNLIGIGIKIGSVGRAENPNIEDTLVAGAIEGMQGDYRVLSLTTDWFTIHYERLNVDRLTALVKELGQSRVKAYFAALAKFLSTDPRFKRLSRCYRGPAVSLLEEGTDFLIQRNGEDERFRESCLKVPNKTLRHRPDDIESPEELAKKHRDYYYRVLVGPSFRADMISLLERDPNLSPSELARRTYGSFQTAWCVIKDLSLLNYVQDAPHKSVS
jgi:hypothetical protein